MDIRKIITEVLEEIVAKTDSYTSFLSAKEHMAQGMKNLYLHFTDVPKLGINPQKSHADPHAIYFYPVEWVTDERNWKMFQYGVLKDYFYLVQLNKKNMLNLSSMKENLAVFLMDNAGLLDAWYRYSSDFKGGVGKRFWAFLDMLNVKPSERDNPNHRDLPQVTWNQFWKTTDYDGFYDSRGIVNEEEPYQAGVFNSRAIKIIDSGENDIASGSYDKFFNKLIEESGITVKKKGWEKNGQEFRIYGVSDSGEVDIHIIPSDYMAYAYYSDEEGNIYKTSTDRSAFDSLHAQENIRSLVSSVAKKTKGPINFKRLNAMRATVSEVFVNIFSSSFRSFGGYDPRPMEFLRMADNARDTFFRGEVGYQGDDLVLSVEFSVSKEYVAGVGDPVDVFTSVVDKYPNRDEEFYKKEMDKRGVIYNPDGMGDEVFVWKDESKKEAASPEFKYEKKVTDPKAAHQDLISEFEKWMDSINWVPGNPEARLAFQKLGKDQRVRNKFYEEVKSL